MRIIEPEPVVFLESLQQPLFVRGEVLAFSNRVVCIVGTIEFAIMLLRLANEILIGNCEAVLTGDVLVLGKIQAMPIGLRAFAGANVFRAKARYIVRRAMPGIKAFRNARIVVGGDRQHLGAAHRPVGDDVGDRGADHVFACRRRQIGEHLGRVCRIDWPIRIS
jgi:hypothetical protein